MKIWLEKLLERKRNRLFSAEMPSSRIVAGQPARAIAPHHHYFRITLSEMHLELKSQLTREFIPMGLAAIDFSYAGQPESRPVCISSQLLKNIQGKQAGDYIELNNTSILGPVPYQGDDVGLFIGLARLQVSDLAKAFCNLLEAVAAPLSIVGIPHYTGIGRALLSAVDTFLGHHDTELQFGYRNVFTTGSNQFREGYWLYTNFEGNLFDKKDLWVKDDRLWQDAACQSPATGFDYCLVRIEAIDERTDYRLLPFFKTWQQIETLLLETNHRRAETKKIEMLQQIVTSPDLTERHKEGLMVAFTARYVEMAERYHAVSRRKVTRGGESGPGQAEESHLQAGLDRLKASLAGPTYPSSVLKKVSSIASFGHLPPATGERQKEAEDQDPAWLTAAVSQASQSPLYDGRDSAQLADLLAAPFIVPQER